MRHAWVAGVDVGGTHIKIGLVNGRGRVVREQVLSSDAYGLPQRFVEAVSRVIERLTESVGLSPAKLDGVGVGIPGPVDVQRGIVHSCVNLPQWRHVPLRRILTRRLSCAVHVDNDANMVTLGIWRFGAGKGAEHLVCVTIGTGVGGGLMFGKQLYRGASGSAGEIGHMVVNPRGRLCACGVQGCLEAMVGTAAILSKARYAIRKGSEPLRTLANRAQVRLTPELISQAARAGDRQAQLIWEGVGFWLGVGLANVANVLNPDRIVIGGGLANAWSLFAPTMKRTLRKQAMRVPAQALQVVRDSLGHRAGILGAWELVWQEKAHSHH